MADVLKPVTKPLNELVKKVSNPLKPITASTPLIVKHSYHNVTPSSSFPSYITPSPAKKSKTSSSISKTPASFSKTLQPNVSDDSESESTSPEDSLEDTPPSSPPSFEKSFLEDKHGKIAAVYLRAYNTSPVIVDQRYGLRMLENGEWGMGSKVVKIKNDEINIEGKTYGGTSGLFELITRSNPSKNTYTERDLMTYKAMLIQTNAHKVGYDVYNKINGNRGVKYTTIIAPLFGKTPGKKQGHGIYKKYKKNVDYRYYKNPNKLVQRLKFLIGAQEAGHDGLDNEIKEIFTELRETKVI